MIRLLAFDKSVEDIKLARADFKRINAEVLSDFDQAVLNGRL
jgi:hypothetical protein